MSVVNTLSRSGHLEEFNSPLDTAGGVLSPLTRKNRVKTNLGMQVAVTGGARRFFMPAPATATGTATLTTTQLLTGLIEGTPAAAASYTLPTAASLDAAVPDLQVGEVLEFTILNLSTTAANDITVVTNTGLTLVGELVIEADEATQLLPSAGTFWARKTAAGAYRVTRVGS